MSEILTDAYLLFTFVFKQALKRMEHGMNITAMVLLMPIKQYLTLLAIK